MGGGERRGDLTVGFQIVITLAAVEESEREAIQIKLRTGRAVEGKFIPMRRSDKRLVY